MDGVIEPSADVPQASKEASAGRLGQVLIIGAGPAGMVASRYLTACGIAHDVVDRHGECGGAYKLMYAGIQLSSPPRYLGLPGARPPVRRGYMRAGEYLTYLREYAEAQDIKVQKEEVTAIRRRGVDFEVAFVTSDPPRRYRVVIVCTGSFECPYVPTIPGLTTPSPSIPWTHAAKWAGPSEFVGRRLLIIGARITGVEIAEECVAAGIRPIVSANTPRVRLYPCRVCGVNPRRLVYPFMRYFPLMLFRTECERGWRYRGVNRGFAKYVADGRIVVRPQVVAAHSGLVEFSDGTREAIDTAVFATGYRHNMPFLPDEIPRRSHGVPRLRRGESIEWPGLFILGVPCAFAGNSQFVFGIVADARRVADSVRARIKRTES